MKCGTKTIFSVLFFNIICLSSAVGQQSILIEREGIRTSESAKFPVLWEELTPSDLKKLAVWYILPWAPQPQSEVPETIQIVFYYLINYLSYYAVDEPQRQIDRFISEFQTKGEYRLTIIDKDSNVVSQFSANINILPSGMHQPIVRFIFPHSRY